MIAFWAVLLRPIVATFWPFILSSAFLRRRGRLFTNPKKAKQLLDKRWFRLRLARFAITRWLPFAWGITSLIAIAASITASSAVLITVSVAIIISAAASARSFG